MPKGPHATLLTYGLPQMPQNLLDVWEKCLRAQQALLTTRLREVEAEQMRRKEADGHAICSLKDFGRPPATLGGNDDRR